MPSVGTGLDKGAGVGYAYIAWTDESVRPGEPYGAKPYVQ
jgi:hypothetical protein